MRDLGGAPGGWRSADMLREQRDQDPSFENRRHHTQGEARHGTLAKTLNKAADMLDAVWKQYVKDQDDLKPGGTD